MTASLDTISFAVGKITGNANSGLRHWDLTANPEKYKSGINVSNGTIISKSTYGKRAFDIPAGLTNGRRYIVFITSGNYGYNCTPCFFASYEIGATAAASLASCTTDFILSPNKSAATWTYDNTKPSEISLFMEKAAFPTSEDRVRLHIIECPI